MHCAGGRSRSAALVAAFLMSSYGLSCTQALEQCRAARPLVNVNIGFQLQLLAFGASGCDVHAAHQILLHKRLERFSDKLLAAALEADAACAAAAAASAADDLDLSSDAAQTHDAKGSAYETEDGNGAIPAEAATINRHSPAARLGKKPPSLKVQRSESAPQQGTSSSSLGGGGDSSDHHHQGGSSRSSHHDTTSNPVRGWRTSGRRGTASVDEAEEALLAVLDAPLSQSAAPHPNWPKQAASSSSSATGRGSADPSKGTSPHQNHYNGHQRRTRSRSGSSSDGHHSSSDCEGTNNSSASSSSSMRDQRRNRCLPEPLSPASPLDPGVPLSRGSGSRLPPSSISATKPISQSTSDSTSGSTSGRSRSKSGGGSGRGAQLRLSRPHMAAVQVIPPLRALERPLSCRQCRQPLFAYASVLRLDLDPELVNKYKTNNMTVISWRRDLDSSQYTLIC